MNVRENQAKWHGEYVRLLRAALIGLLLGVFAAGCSAQEQSVSEAASLSCGTAARFNASDLQKPAADPASDDAGMALAAFLSSPEARSAHLPSAAWVRLVETSDTTLFVTQSPAAEAPLAMAELRREGGFWTATSWGGCLPRYVSDRAEAAAWTLAAPVRRSDQELSVLVTDPNCARPGGELNPVLKPVVEYGAESIAVTIWVNRDLGSGGVEGCAGSPQIPASVALEEPLGERVVMDGGVVPARRVLIGTPDIDPGDASPGPAIR